MTATFIKIGRCCNFFMSSRSSFRANKIRVFQDVYQIPTLCATEIWFICLGRNPIYNTNHKDSTLHKSLEPSPSHHSVTARRLAHPRLLQPSELSHRLQSQERISKYSKCSTNRKGLCHSTILLDDSARAPKAIPIRKPRMFEYAGNLPSSLLATPLWHRGTSKNGRCLSCGSLCLFGL